jgi:hypothetical protein
MKINAALLMLALASTAIADPDNHPQQMIQQQYAPPPPVQEQLETRLSDRCKIKLEYYRAMVEEVPSSWYYKYLLNKWEDRCL